FQCAANCRGSLTHPSKPIVARRRSSFLAHGEASPVVPYFQRDFRGSVIQPNGKMLRVCVLLYIMDGFLGHAQDFTLRARWERPIGPIDTETRLKTMAVRFLCHAPQTHRQSLFSRILRTQRPDRLARFSQPFSHMRARRI